MNASWPVENYGGGSGWRLWYGQKACGGWPDGIVESHGGRLKRERTTPVDVVGLKLRHNWPIEFHLMPQ